MKDCSQVIDVRVINDGSLVSVDMGTTLLDIVHKCSFEQPHPVLVARVNNRFKPLGYKVYKPVTVEFLDITSWEGYRVYQRTISFVLQKAVVRSSVKLKSIYDASPPIGLPPKSVSTTPTIPRSMPATESVV